MDFPNARADEHYNQKYLNEKDKEFLIGYDYNTEKIVDNFFDNLEYLDCDYLLEFLAQEIPDEMKETYEMVHSFSEDSENVGEMREVVTYTDFIRSKLLEHIECERDHMIKSMIDNMDSEEYERIKKAVDGITDEDK